MDVYDRSTGQTRDEAQYGGAIAGLLYNNPVGRLLLNHVALKPWFSALGACRDTSAWSVRKIGPFADQFAIDLAEYEKGDYATFAEFFTRRIRPEARPVGSGLISPADAKLTAVRIDDRMVVTVKGATYTVADLLGDPELAATYADGTLLLFRLTVDDYHRYSYVDSGEVIGGATFTGDLHTVGPASFGWRVYATNTRSWSLLRTESLGDVVQIEVGAMLVGSIVNHPVRTFAKGDEKGYFDLGGSTIIVLLRAGAATVDADIRAQSRRGVETKVRMNESIGSFP